MKYTIRVTALAIVESTLEVEADTPLEAGKKAIKEAKANGTCGFEINDMYNDGKPNCRVCAVDGFDEDGNDYEEDDLTPEIEEK